MPKKGERETCLACGGTGKILVIRNGKTIVRSCIACGGKGFFVY